MSASATITVRLFARLRERAGTEQISLSAHNLQTVADVLNAIARESSGLEPYLDSVMLARNGTYCTRDEPVTAGDEIALIPPVSGG